MPIETIYRGVEGDSSKQFKAGEAFDTAQANDEYLDSVKPTVIENVAALASTPVVAGRTYYLKEYHAGTGKGGGELVGVAGSTAYDNGITFAGSGGYFSRINYTYVTPQMFGAKGDGVADDTAAVQAAIDSGAKLIRFYGIYNIGAAGLTGQSNQTWMGDGIGLTTIKCAATPTLDFIKFNSKTNFFIRGIRFDGNGLLTALGGSYPNLLPIILASECSYFEICDNEFIGFRTVGVLTNIARDYKINRNIVTRTGTDGTIVNYGIGSPGGSGGSENYRGEICHNTLTRCNIAANTAYTKINYNNIAGWAFSSGVDLVVDASCHDNEVIGNIIQDSVQAPDKDAFFPCGIENWSKNTVIKDNIIFGCYGDGIENGGRDCTISGNVCRNNGSSGLYNLYQDATYNASGTVANGNIFIDNDEYGIREQSASLSDLKYGSEHKLTGNGSGKFSILSSSSEYYDSGTVSLTIVGGSTPGTQSYSTNSFYYERKGLVYTITGRIALSAATGTGALRISGLPYTSKNYFGALPISWSGSVTNYVSMTGIIPQSQNYIIINANTAAATGQSTVQMSDVSATSFTATFTATILL